MKDSKTSILKNEKRTSKTALYSEKRNSLTTISEEQTGNVEEKLIQSIEPAGMEVTVSGDMLSLVSEEKFQTTISKESLDKYKIQDKMPRRASSVIRASATYSEKLLALASGKGTPLFSKVVDTGSQSISMKSTSSVDTSILITGFGLRNLSSLQNALQEDERKRLRELYRRSSKEQQEGEEAATTVASSQSMTTKASQKSALSQTDVSSSLSATDVCSEKNKRLEYLMGVMPDGEEEYVEPKLERIVYEEVDEPFSGTSQATRQAQKYLHAHKIFEFFQFLTAHMLSALPDNPIEFLVDLLNNCIVYRGGMGAPPLLYNKTHIGVLFDLMDRMRTGFITESQYKTGMVTLGICSFNKNAPLNYEGLVSKEFFIQEGYECLTNIFNDMVRRRWVRTPVAIVPPPPPTPRSSINLSERQFARKMPLLFPMDNVL